MDLLKRLTGTLLLLFIMSCGANDKQKKSTDNGKDGDPFVSLRLSPKEDKAYRYNILTNTETAQEIRGEEVINSSNLDIGMDYSFRKDSANNLLIDVKYTKFKVQAKIGDVEQMLDAQTAASSYNPSERVFGAFQGAIFTAVMDSNGNVLAVRGIDGIRSKMYQLAGGNAETIGTIKTTLEQYLNEKFFRQTIEQSFQLLTKKELRVGDTVVKRSTLDGGLPVGLQTVYTVAAIENGLAAITSSATIDLKEQPMQVEGTQTLATLKGSQTGRMQIDIATGMVKNSESGLKLKGELQVMGNHIPVQIKLDSKASQVE